MDEELNCEECGSIFAIKGIDVDGEDQPQYCPYCGDELYEWIDDVDTESDYD